MEAAGQVFDIDTQRMLAKYDIQKQNYQTQADRNRQDYERYTSDQHTQTNRQLANTSKDFSRKLAAASSAYGQRGILRSGITTQKMGEATQDYNDQQTFFKTQSQRQLEEGKLKYGQQLEDIGRAQSQLETERGQYAGDRSVGIEILKTELQYQGDTQYNKLQTEMWATEQQRLGQQAKNQVMGTTKAPSLRTWRVGGKYTQ